LNGAWDVRVWIIGLLATCLAYLLSREFTRKDQISADLQAITARFTVSIEELNKGVAALTLAIEEIRLWSTDKFVSRIEHKENLEAVKADIKAAAARFENELVKCEARCPERCEGR